MDGQGTKCRRNIAENLNRLSRAHERYRQTDDRRQTDGRAIAYSEREREFTFAKNTEIVELVKAIESTLQQVLFETGYVTTGIVFSISKQTGWWQVCL